MKIYRGEQYALPFIVEVDGVPVTPSMITDAKIKIGDFVGTYQKGTFLWDEESQVWYVLLTESLTRSFKSGTKRVTVGLKVGTDIFYCDEETVTFADNQIEEAWPNA